MQPAAQSRGFAPRRGVNLSHWLSQRGPDEPKPAGYFSEIDAGFLADCGFDHIRLPVDEQILWEPDGRRREADWQRLHNALAWSRRHRLRVIVDLHIIRAHHFNAGNEGAENTLWTSPAAQDHLVDLWQLLSDELRGYPVDEVAYEIMNEPVAPDPEIWNGILNRVHAAIRAREPRRCIVIGSNLWQKARTVPQLRLPEDDPHILISFHYYEPGPVTHYRASWNALREYTGPVRYPGIPFPAEALPAHPSAALGRILAEGNRHYDRAVIRGDILAAVEYARARGLPLYCGEWGCYRSTPAGLRHAWYRDVLSVLDEFGIGWAIWDYKGGFRIVDPDTFEADTDLIGILAGGARAG